TVPAGGGLQPRVLGPGQGLGQRDRGGVPSVGGQQKTEVRTGEVHVERLVFSGGPDEDTVRDALAGLELPDSPEHLAGPGATRSEVEVLVLEVPALALVDDLLDLHPRRMRAQAAGLLVDPGPGPRTQQAGVGRGGAAIG